MTGHGNDGILNYLESFVAASQGSPAAASVNMLLAD
jgi:hypothetical protein